MAAEGVYKRFVKVDLLIDVPAADAPVFLHSVPVLFRSDNPNFTPYIIGVPNPPHAPSICESVNGSGAHASIDVHGTATGVDCIMPRQKALDLGLQCLFEDILENMDYFGLIKCTVPEETILTGPRASEGLLHVYCSRKMVHEDLPFMDRTVNIGGSGMRKMKLGFDTFADGSSVESVRNKRLVGRKAVLRLTKAQGLPRTYFTPYRIGVPHPPHAPSICESVNGSGAHVSIDVQGTATGVDCMMPRQIAMDLGLTCLFEDIIENIDYFGHIKCTVPGETILTGPKASKGLLHVYCSKMMVHDVPLLDTAVIVGGSGTSKMKLGFHTFLGSETDHVKCQYVCCKRWNQS
ncbi:hypothetical protein KFL_000750200 [Klebsormidium nitens]|uniref:Uncharacterized protein n=1 Tax=Klebsormidium nitens TaxID=105231 RepID=A0A0U9HJ82_KLENI|nr:hypothetical protein KFL_000750200 [Klebsormidium nitens]|eukprot:GAQ81252.1 hypothetical protein KFL_000750200 [Klebsormidium nitens]